MKWADLLHADTDLGKPEVTLIIIGWVWSKMGDRYMVIDNGTLISSVSHKWFNEMSRLIEWFLHVDSDAIAFGLMANLLLIFVI